MSRRVGRGRRRFANVLLFAGLAGVGIWGWWMLRLKVTQSVDNRKFERQVQEQPVRPAAPPSVVEPPKPPENGELVGRLVVPRLRLQAVVREGSDSKVLGVALGHIPGTAMPGTMGNVGVAGHRDTLFRGLRDIRKNDVIEFQTLDATYRYQVESTSVVLPKRTDVLKAGAYPEMTLVTCYPFDYVGSAPDRFIVKARQLVEAGPAPPPPHVAETPTLAPPPPAPVAAPATVAAPVVVAARNTRRDPIVRRGKGRVPFQMAAGHSGYLAPGISMGLSSADPRGRRVSGWMWVMPDRRTIWLKNQSVYEPVVFYGREDGRRRELVITNISNQSVSGYLVLPGGD